MYANSFSAQPIANPQAGERFGPTSPHPDDPQAAGGMIDLTAARREARIVNRRRSIRYTATREHLWVGWWSEDEFTIVEAHLVNISEGGVMIAVNPAPLEAQPVWMRLEGSAVAESLRAVVVDSKWMKLKRRYSVRLAFQAHCPPAFYETAIFGQAIP